RGNDMALHVMEEANRCLSCKKPRCREGCPIHTNIPEVIRLLKDGRLIVKGFWPEKGVRRTKKLQKALERTLKNFARFNDVILDAEHPFQIGDL
ncbi:MAG: hypothetical protein IKH68_09005, partial [Erysipelotrichaceae bacterium]|nr:hypothetical protein [Erysipelotrichaceae bacterium]